MDGPPPKDIYEGYGGSPGDTFGSFGSDGEPTTTTKKKAGANGTSTLGGLASAVGNAASGGTSAGRDLFDSLFANLNYDLLVSKTFYFFFFAAFGSLFPLIAVYFKQLGMNPAQTGVLIGFRPFVEFVSGPFWSNIADRWNKWKQILLFSLFCWVAFTLALAFVSPPPDSCLVHNGSAILVVPPWMATNRRTRELRDDRAQLAAAADDGGFEESPVGMANRRSGGRKTTEEGQEEEGGRGKEGRPGEEDGRKAEEEGQGKGEGEDVETAPSKSEKNEENVKKMPKGQKNEGEARKPSKGQENIDEGVEERPEEEEENGGVRSSVRPPPPPPSTTPYNWFAEGRTVRFLPHPKIDAYGKSPLPLDHKDIANLDEIDARGLVSPPLSAVVYKSIEIEKIFLILLVLMIIGEFLSAPAIELADAATLGYLGDDTENYGRQRLFGSLGWAISMFFVGIALDHSNVFPNHPCGNEQLVDRNYTVCFAVFSVLMCCAFIAATQFRFRAAADGDGAIQLNDLKDRVVDRVQARIIKIRKADRQSLISSDEETPDHGYEAQHKTGNGASSRDGTPAGGVVLDPDRKCQISLQENAGRPVDERPDDPATKPSPYVPRGRPGQSGRLPQWVPVLKMFGTVNHGAVLFILWFMGFGVGLVFTFLFWHLQDMHGTPTLFGIASVINHVSEVCAYFFSKRLITKLGHINVLYIGMLGNVARYLYISYLHSPWWVLPFEFLQGLTHAAVWAAGCSYLTQSIPPAMRPTAQGLLMAIHHGLGRAMGTIIGGAFVHSYGTEYTFRGYGIATIIILAAYLALNYFYIRKYLPQDGPADPSALEETHLAPHGVPISMSRSRSNIDMEDAAPNQQQYGAAGSGSNVGNFLHPGGKASQGDVTGGYQNPYHIGYDYNEDELAKIDMSHFDKITRRITSQHQQQQQQQPQQQQQQHPQQQQQYSQQQQQQYHHQQQQQPQQQGGYRGAREAVIVGNAPRPTTELRMQQPRNLDTGDHDADWY